jgi:anti-anti-sigma regulatory factor
LITAWASLDRSKRRLALVISNPSLMRVFEITDFDELFEIHPTLGAALNGSGNGHG